MANAGEEIQNPIEVEDKTSWHDLRRATHGGVHTIRVGEDKVMAFSELQYREMLARTERNRLREVKGAIYEAVSEEMELHDEIIKHCNSQWPRWKYIRARPDQPSGIQRGCQDFTVFMPGGMVLCVECKSRTGKLSNDQTIWRHEMELLGHTVHEVRSMEHFLNLCRTKSQTTPTT